ncbi:MAG: hypothetical protein ACRYGG_18670, partial [Janthinobacterium lividum]
AGAHVSIAIAVAAHPDATVGTAVRFREVLMEAAQGSGIELAASGVAVDVVGVRASGSVVD